MIIDLTSALKHPGQSFPFSIDGNIDDMDLYGDSITFTNPVKVNGTLMYTGEDFFVRGSFEIDYKTSCGLCFREVIGNVECSFNEEFAISEDISHPDRYTFSGNNIDIAKMINDNLCLNLPLKHLCVEDCLGLCPKCGKNLNENTCDCGVKIKESDFNKEVVRNKKENPFAVLENLFSEDDEEA